MQRAATYFRSPVILAHRQQTAVKIVLKSQMHAQGISVCRPLLLLCGVCMNPRSLGIATLTRVGEHQRTGNESTGKDNTTIAMFPHVVRQYLHFHVHGRPVQRPDNMRRCGCERAHHPTPAPKDQGTQRMWVVHTVLVPHSTIFTDYLRVVPWVLGWGEYLWTAAVKRGRGVPLPLPQRQPETGSDYRRTQLLFPPIRGYKA